MMYYESQLISLLLVESEQGTRKRFHDFLDDTRLNLNITEVNTGEEAVEAFHSNVYDCILLDNELEDMNGQMVLSFFQNGPILSVPVIVFSEETESGLDFELLESGAAEFISKYHCNGLLLRRIILHSLARRQYFKSQQEYLISQDILSKESYWFAYKSQLEALKTEKEHAQEASRAKSSFLSNMSHELRTPLNAILGFAQLLIFKSTEPLTESQQDNVNEILKAGNHLLALINDVLDLSKIEAGKIGIKKDKVDVNTTIKECIKLTAEMATAKACEISYDESELPLISADVVRFKQVMLNLLSNAVKYNRVKGSVDICCHVESDGMMTVKVQDTGIGIDKEHFSEVFQPFSRLNATNTAIEGTGIGLALSRQLIEEMGGKIGFDSKKHVGSCFWLCLPLVSQNPLPVGTRAQRLLYIDGNFDQLLELKKSWSKDTGVELIATDLLDMALKLTHRKPSQLVIVDFDMLDTPLLEIIKALRHSESLAQARVIGIGSEFNDNDLHCGLAAGFDQILPKPLSIEGILDLAYATFNLS